MFLILHNSQTGSGKTFSMGTALDDSLDSEQQGNTHIRLGVTC